MVSFAFLILVQGILLRPCLSLLEERFVSFDQSPGAIAIHDAPIIFSADDFKGVRIAAESLTADLTAVTGVTKTLVDLNKANFTRLSGAILVGTVNSTLIRSLTKNGTNGAFSTAEINGKWEAFKTQVVKNPLPGVESALVISGSDKRGTIFGIHTLAEQCGQSP
jgi:hypothetical protein